MKVKKDKVKLITLGCSKNLVDSEHILAQLRNNDVEIVEDEDKCETVIVNTCGFIQDAKEESINTILRAVRKKEEGQVKNVYVAGCLSDRYKTDLEKEIPEVDKYFGATDKKQTLVDLLNEIGINYKDNLLGERDISTPAHYAYLKISEGCNNPCSFCAIPIMRGKHVSKPAEQVLMEAQKLASKGVKELIIIGQDTTYWGFDIDKKRGLAYLMEELSKVSGIEWMRLMYAYPSRFPHELLDLMRDTPNICNYIDIPVQHVSDNVLKSMRRGITKKTQVELMEKIRKEVPGISIRTTLLTGYPDETEKDFNELLDFVKEFKFDRLGVFTYSHEDDTHAYNLPDKIPVKEKRLRQKLLLDAQREISLKNNEASIGQILDVIIDREENGQYVGRTYKDAPEIDQEVYINNNNGLRIGDIISSKIYDFEEFDLFAEKM
ncbi:MAG TPA: 30S ribosomal protein S12 methylthiotransferase RimO [Ignavibacteria bacterium]|nr:30S ribosomal protein S12 methylthiotransferase RimO [Ignavibacteria bacterium]